MTGKPIWRTGLAWCLTGLCLLAALTAIATPVNGPQHPAAAAVEQPAMAWSDILRSGGALMFVLGVLSVGALAFVIYLFFVLRLDQVAPRALQRELVEHLRVGEPERARRACEDRPCPLAVVALAAMDFAQNAPGTDTVLIKDMMEGEGSRQAEAIQGQTQYLLDIAVIAPMIGLLGTVFGLLQAFGGVALDIAKARPVVLAEGVSKALITTAAGLVVGIPAMAFYAYFRRRGARLVAGLETAAAEMMRALTGARDTRRGTDGLI